ncbi:MAG: TlpA family protein disulfide reductase [Phycisphaerales bacterium]|nr:MAG: TlpA family protein disulfide reductase [Phycisphaerales bacterium]
MSDKNHNRVSLVTAFLAALMISLVIGAGCKKKTEEPNRTAQGGPEAANPEQTAMAPGQTPTPEVNEPDEPEVKLRDIIMAARYWEPGYTSWIGQPAPDFTLTDLDGREHRLSGYRGKNVVLVFWATWCRPCRMEIPHLVELRNTTGEDELVILGISHITPRNPEEKISSFVAENKQMNYPVLAAKANSMPAPFKVIPGLPSMFFIGADGKIKFGSMGLVSLGELRSILKAI